MKQSKLNIGKKQLRFVQGIFICLVAIFLALNFGAVSQFFFWIFSFLLGTFFTYLFYLILFFFGISFMINKKVAFNNLKFALIGIILICVGVLFITTHSVTSADGEVLVFSNFVEKFKESISLQTFPRVQLRKSCGLIGFLFVSIFNSAFTPLGTTILSSVLIAVGIVFVLLRPIIELIRSSKDILTTKEINQRHLQYDNDENLLDDGERLLMREQVQNESYQEIVDKKSAEETISEEPVKEELPPPTPYKQYIIEQTNGLQKVVFDPENERKSIVETRENNEAREEHKPPVQNAPVSFSRPVVEQNNYEDEYEANEEETVENYDTNEEFAEEYTPEIPEPEVVEEKHVEPAKPLMSVEELINKKDSSLYGEQEDITNTQQAEELARKLKEENKKKPKQTSYANIKYRSPSSELLDDRVSKDQDEDNIKVADARTALINETFKDFKVRAEICSYKIGPSVTRYDVLPAKDYQIKNINNIVDDISIRLGGVKIRFIPVVIGKNTGGIEISNDQRSIVNFKDIYLNMPEPKPGKFYIPLGKNISGDYISTDLAKTPHLLVCGATGSGKSVCVQAMILSLIMRHSMADVRLVLIDPKQVEFSAYRDLPHLLCPVITEATEANACLNKLVDEMEDRFRAISDAGVRDIKSYNEVQEEKKGEKMPYIFVFIDEYADLVDSSKTVKDPVKRLTQKARACGIHLIVATQRPSVNVIDGVIKGNIPSRIALSTSSSTDSQTVLDVGGAEKLLGNGDMLIKIADVEKGELTRVQGCFVDDREIARITSYIKDTYPLEYNQKFCNLLEKARQEQNDLGTVHNDGNDDLMYENVKQTIMESDNEYISISKIQRMFNFGYPKSMKIFNRLIEENVLEKPESSNSSKGARVLVHLGGAGRLNEQNDTPGTYSQSSFKAD
ncbi:MAG: DNA translocase FtsK [Bacilli bacterium]|nr:DNA translocase FtsK [Bacilli bacterium]